MNEPMSIRHWFVLCAAHGRWHWFWRKRRESGVQRNAAQLVEILS